MSCSDLQLANIDWDFVNLENSGVYGFHWYPATFLSALPGSLIPLLSKEDDIVLDPFCGVGTTGVEAIRLGRRFTGIDANPVAVLISRAKLSFPDTDKLVGVFGELGSSSIFGTVSHASAVGHPNERELLGWYHPSTYRELLSILMTIRLCDDAHVRTAAQAAFSSVLKTVSSQSRHWGWVCDNVKPRPSEVRYKNARDAFTDAVTSFAAGLDHVLRDVEARRGRRTGEELRRCSNLICEDAVRSMSRTNEASVDLIVTSPPYYGVADYVKSQRLSFLWFHEAIMPVEGYSSSDFEVLRQRETGCRSFRRRPTSFDDYMVYMQTFVRCARRVLKPGAKLCLVLGESRARESTIGALHACALACGFECCFREYRAIRATRRRLMAKVPNEEIMVYASPK